MGIPKERIRARNKYQLQSDTNANYSVCTVNGTPFLLKENSKVVFSSGGSSSEADGGEFLPEPARIAP
jgi:hypothetical protein